MGFTDFIRRLKSGSIFNRVIACIRTRQIKWKDRPMWMDIYIALPPYNEPRFDQKYGNWGGKIRPILYEEDEIRAEFTKRYGIPDIINMVDLKHPSDSQRFWLKYKELKTKSPNLDPETLWNDTEDYLMKHGDEHGRIPLTKYEYNTTKMMERYGSRQAQLTLRPELSQWKK